MRESAKDDFGAFEGFFWKESNKVIHCKVLGCAFKNFFQAFLAKPLQFFYFFLLTNKTFAATMPRHWLCHCQKVF